MGTRQVVLALAIMAGCETRAPDAGDDLVAGSGSGSGSAKPLPKLLARGGLSFEIIDDTTGQRSPGKLTLVGVQGTTDPKFSKDIGLEDDDGWLAAYNRIFSMTGVGAIAVPVGTYDITVSRGLEWTIATQRIKVTSAGAELHARIKHVVESKGWVSADFHVHSASSPDSRVPMAARVYEFVADGVDMIVSTDHNVVANYKPVIEELHAEKLLASACGDEITSGAWGHFGAFPLPHDIDDEGNGAIAVRKKTAAEIFKQVRTVSPEAIVNIHHPRLERAIGYFILGKFDDQRDTSTRKGFSYDFDAIELLNGYQDTNHKSIDRIMRDWFALLNRGHIVTATGNSDTHHLNYNLGGYPRNYVLVANDDPAVVTGIDVARGVKAHHVFFTTGPYVETTIGTTGIGDLAPAPGGKATLDIVVKAPPWVSVSRVIVYITGIEAKRWTVPAGTAVERFHEKYDLAVAADTYVLVRVEGDQPLTPVVGGGTSIAVTPFAMTNPIFLDTNNNKKYDPKLPHGPHASPEAP
ncbi:MAG: CehA/McbA family metallohydrolase [Kofleriaceae bacterium]